MENIIVLAVEATAGLTAIALMLVVVAFAVMAVCAIVTFVRDVLL